ncbi:ganglioside GM2 activator-like [Octopus sinensis]|uniref:Ganglioside GM2 activator-like n=1 Tax=Octopus sinensis TaxID=2607531 RepID=A0A6P7SLX9_9MOLL|nr:ganglioside GM2 activator-like [Octopus sinensis]
MKSFVTLFILLLLELNKTFAGKRRQERSVLRFADCGKSQHRVITINHVRINPMPIVAPGTVYLSMAGTLSHDLPRRLTVDLNVTKYIFKVPFRLPCFNRRFGSCMYDNICNSLEKYQIYGCPKELTDKNLRCHCPFLNGNFRIDKLPLSIPKFGGFAGPLINGHYKLHVRVLGDEKEELGCLELKFSIRKRSKGWFFKT